jgi:hypothetical protein
MTDLLQIKINIRLTELLDLINKCKSDIEHTKLVDKDIPTFETILADCESNDNQALIKVINTIYKNNISISNDQMEEMVQKFMTPDNHVLICESIMGGFFSCECKKIAHKIIVENNYRDICDFYIKNADQIKMRGCGWCFQINKCDILYLIENYNCGIICWTDIYTFFYDNIDIIVTSKHLLDPTINNFFFETIFKHIDVQKLLIRDGVSHYILTNYIQYSDNIDFTLLESIFEAIINWPAKVFSDFYKTIMIILQYIDIDSSIYDRLIVYALHNPNLYVPLVQNNIIIPDVSHLYKLLDINSDCKGKSSRYIYSCINDFINYFHPDIIFNQDHRNTLYALCESPDVLVKAVPDFYDDDEFYIRVDYAQWDYSPSRHSKFILWPKIDVLKYLYNNMNLFFRPGCEQLICYLMPVIEKYNINDKTLNALLIDNIKFPYCCNYDHINIIVIVNLLIQNGNIIKNKSSILLSVVFGLLTSDLVTINYSPTQIYFTNANTRYSIITNTKEFINVYPLIILSYNNHNKKVDTLLLKEFFKRYITCDIINAIRAGPFNLKYSYNQLIKDS